MEKLDTGYHFKAQLFGEGGGAGAGAAGSAASGSGTAEGSADAGAQEMGPGKRQKKNPLADVQYGIQAEEAAPAAGEQEQQDGQ